MRVRDIIRPQMTILRFMHSKGLEEAYFQNVCQAAWALANFYDEEFHHPYSFQKAKSYYEEVEKYLG